MEHSLSYSIVLSPLIFLLTAGFGVVLALRWPRAGLGCIALSLAALYALATPLLSGLLIAGLEDGIDAGTATARPPAAIVILSGDIAHAADPAAPIQLGALSLERVYFGVRQYRASPTPILVTGGALAGTDIPIATLMAESLAKDFGVPTRWRETQSRTTYENAEFSAAILKSNGISSIILVTQRWHMRRAIWAFRQFGIDAVPTKFAYRETSSGRNWDAFIPSPSGLSLSAYAIHEILGLAYYRLAK